MNKILASVTVILLLSLAACTPNTTDPIPEYSTSSFSGETVTSGYAYETTDPQTFFSHRMESNPVDQAFKDNLNSGDDDLRGLYSEYAQRWEEELYYAVFQCQSLMPQEDYDRYRKQNEDWLSALKSSFEIETEQLGAKKLGTYFMQTNIERLAQQLRQRALEVKYYSFIMETELCVERYNQPLVSYGFAFSETSCKMSVPTLCTIQSPGLA